MSQVPFPTVSQKSSQSGGVGVGDDEPQIHSPWSPPPDQNRGIPPRKWKPNG
ncbi:hypothetical protein BDQ94DRAFT_152625 [Aspergillus welwitschiae]|uniref:Uncharacterized protein n=1 Tax=Aspergillus welwitschiae TaxID=1341132 RepID=A0A3F3PMI3_9EURO|nr:hypothetical protein BDQ94DRAFT_152625 [Aspergillus welwitschiae]RDH28137.1 hypothetical protein BDQ94DRAFT_152625 [Aspergillus welwitschiae]